jgi:anthraniloyl-CoA monooxygenase
MKIAVLGGGPSGIYLAISMMIRDDSHEITIYERNKSSDTFGWGVVFSDQTMDNLRANDLISAETMISDLIRWDDVDVHIHGAVEKSGGHGFIGIGRQRMLEILYERAQGLGIKLVFEHEFDAETVEQDFAWADLIVASDGINSSIRNKDLEGFDCDIDIRPNHFVWYGTHKNFNEAFTFILENTEHGWIYAHAYQFDKNTSTFIVECNDETYKSFGFDKMSQDDSARLCEKIFEKYLDNNELMMKSSHIRGSAWMQFPRVLCKEWVKGRIVLIGDAAHTAHFSIGSGTKLGFEDAISLAAHLNSGEDITKALKTYQDERTIEALRLQSTARNSMTWFEEIERYVDFDTLQFAYSCITRSQRVSHENLRLRDQKWLEKVEIDFASKAYGRKIDKPVPPMFTPYTIRNMKLKNRVCVAPMAMYSAVDGLVTDFHLVHYGARAMGGAALLYTEMTVASKLGRITSGCAGIYTDEQVEAWKKITSYVHQNSNCKIACQIGHAGRKGSTTVGWEGYDRNLEAGGWDLIAPSALRWSETNRVPKAMGDEDFDRILNEFVVAAKNADKAGFDMIEFHAAHGYLMSSFISPLSNERTDQYGGSLENRLRFPLKVFKAMRAAFPEEKPISVRISATDWLEDQGLGVTAEESVLISKAFIEAGADIINVSTGMTQEKVFPIYGRMFQTPIADRIRNDGGIATMAVGNIFETDHVNSILAAGRADLVLIGRPHLMDPNWTIRAAAELEYRGEAVDVPKQYLTAYNQLEINLKRAAEMAINA